ncbi:MAG: hypothetical protein DLM70_09465 [Chloroflexi bacterium]|nr:MAG: hypothetical protein DLM70_09465 [Chloroflexota bacterium]
MPARVTQGIQITASPEGARQFLDSLLEHKSVEWNGKTWVKQRGSVTLATLAALSVTRFPEGGPEDGTPSFVMLLGMGKTNAMFDRFFDLPAQTTTDLDDFYTLAEIFLHALQAWLHGEGIAQYQKWLDGQKRTPIPREMDQATFIEARRLGQGYSDGPTGQNWEASNNENELIHYLPNESLQLKVVPSGVLNWLGQPATVESIKAELQQAGVPAVLALHSVLHLIIENERVYVELDDLIRSLGWKPRSVAERGKMRSKVWRWLVLFQSSTLVGCRPGTYKDPMTRQIIDLTMDGPLIAITGRERAAQQAFDDSAPPIAVELVAGSWVSNFRNNRKVLSYYGDIRRLGRIQAGKPSGTWAQSIGLALHQRWREGATRSSHKTVGQDNHLTACRDKPFTRYELLTLFRPVPSVEDVLSGSNPVRAQTYWTEAIKLLKNEGVIGHYCELEKLPDVRQGWHDTWLNQPLDIRPTQESAKTQARLARTAERAKRRGRPPKKITS